MCPSVPLFRSFTTFTVIIVIICLSVTGNSSSDNEVDLIESRQDGIDQRIRYFLFDQGSETWAPLENDGDVIEELWNEGGSLKVLIHGFNGIVGRDPSWVMQSMFVIGREYSRRNDSLNIIAVDWTPLASAPPIRYDDAARNTFAAGISMTRYLRKLRRGRAFKSWKQVHLLGFSLGAHAAGVIGNRVQRITNGQKIARITGLDPAGPSFDPPNGLLPEDTSRILDSSDADFVDIIHCNMWSPMPGATVVNAFFTGTFGSRMQAGHVDFYPNGGERQSYQCTQVDDFTGCSHNMCPLYFALSLRTDLAGCPCNSWMEYTSGICPCAMTPRGRAVYLGDASIRKRHARGSRVYMYISTRVSIEYFDD